MVADVAAPSIDRASAMFKEQWATYQRVLEFDYMYHEQMYAAVRAYLEARFAGAPARSLAVLDLGSGDSDYLARMLKASPKLQAAVGSYTAVDLSAPALAISAANMAAALPGLPSSALRYQETDMIAAVAGAPECSCDLVFASFSLHHLSPEQKADAVQQICRALRPGGCCVLVDIFRAAAGEARPAWLARFRDTIAGWRGLARAEADAIFGHVAECDFPEPVAAWQRWVEQAQGGGTFAVLCCCGQEMFQAVAWHKP